MAASVSGSAPWDCLAGKVFHPGFNMPGVQQDNFRPPARSAPRSRRGTASGRTPRSNASAPTAASGPSSRSPGSTAGTAPRSDAVLLKASVDRLHVRLRLAPDVRGKEHRGNGDALVDLHSEAQLHGLIELVRQTTDAQPASDAPGESA